MRNRHFGTALALAVALISAPAWASITITQTFDPAPTYSNTLNFDEVGGPTGNVANNAFASIGISNFDSGEGTTSVGDNSAAYPWLPAANNNTAQFPFGMILQFDQDLTELSFQGWDNGGPASPFGGGAVIYLLLDGDENNPVAAEAFTPAWDGFGNSWYNITTSGGMVFDEIRFFGNSFIPESIADNISWNSVPEPSSLLLLTMTGVGVLIRRRR